MHDQQAIAMVFPEIEQFDALIAQLQHMIRLNHPVRQNKVRMRSAEKMIHAVLMAYEGRPFILEYSPPENMVPMLMAVDHISDGLIGYLGDLIAVDPGGFRADRVGCDDPTRSGRTRSG